MALEGWEVLAVVAAGQTVRHASVQQQKQQPGVSEWQRWQSQLQMPVVQTIVVVVAARPAVQLALLWVPPVSGHLPSL